MKKSFNYHDPRAKSVVVKAMTESHMIHHYRKIQNVIPYVDTNIRKKPTVQRYVLRCDCGNRILNSDNYPKRNFRQNEYKKHVKSGVPCSRFRRCFNEDTNGTTVKPCNKMGKSKLKLLTDVYHPPRTKPQVVVKDEVGWCQSQSDSDGYNSNSEEPSKFDAEYIDLLKKITDDILNNSLYTSSELKKLFKEHLKSNAIFLTQEEIQNEIHHLEQELKFSEESMPSYKMKSFKPTSYSSFKLEDLNLSPQTLASIKQALITRQTEDSCSQTNQDFFTKSDQANEKDNLFEVNETSVGDLDLESDAQGENNLMERQSSLEEHQSNITSIHKESNEDRERSANQSEKDYDLESLEDFSSIHSYQD